MARKRWISTDWAQAVAMSDLAATTKLVGLVLALHMRESQGGRVYVSADTLAAKCSITSRSARDHRKALAAAGFLRVVNPGGGNGLAWEAYPTFPSGASTFSEPISGNVTTRNLAPDTRNLDALKGERGSTQLENNYVELHAGADSDGSERGPAPADAVAPMPEHLRRSKSAVKEAS